MSDDAPLRLKHARATSPELAQALRALGRSSDGKRLERVAQQLESALAGGAPQPTAAGGLGSLALKWMIAGVLAAGGFWAWHAAQLQPSAAVNARPAVVPPQLASASDPAAVGGEAPSPSVAAAPPALVPAKPRASVHVQGARHAKMPSAANAAETRDATAAAPAPAADDTTPAPIPSAANEPAPTPPALHERSHSQPPPAAAAQAGGERSEAALLLAARKAQPSAALSLLAEHATRFPDGLLAPEREVLRIEALRKLGRSAEAEQDLRAFQARYPDSIHLRRLLATRPD